MNLIWKPIHWLWSSAGCHILWWTFCGHLKQLDCPKYVNGDLMVDDRRWWLYSNRLLTSRIMAVGGSGKSWGCCGEIWDGKVVVTPWSLKGKNKWIYLINILWKKKQTSKYVWVRSWRCACLVNRFCYQMIAKPGNKTSAHSWPDPYSWYNW